MSETTQRHGAGTVVLLGNFDGVHLGHLALARAARQLADEARSSTTALVFDPHPTHLLAPDRQTPLLTSLGRRAELLRGAGVDQVVVQRFDQAFSTLTPEAFVDTVLRGRLGARAVVVGTGYRFGRGRKGDLQSLQALGAARGFSVAGVEPVLVGAARVSSTRVRELLAQGEVGEAVSLLGRIHDIEGRVARGDGRGRKIGFATANLAEVEGMLPLDGVYAAWARPLGRPGQVHAAGARPTPAVVNLGTRPTFGAGRSAEVHLLEGSPDLYEQRLRVGFARRLRGEQRFEGVDALCEQIKVDIERAKETLAQSEPTLLRQL